MSGTQLPPLDDAAPDFSVEPVSPLESSLVKSGIPAAPVAVEGPAYRVVSGSKIAVSKQRGKLWKSRKKTGEKAMKDYVAAWDEAIRYYNHEVGGKRS